jgi:hypothetical protein
MCPISAKRVENTSGDHLLDQVQKDHAAVWDIVGEFLSLLLDP